MNKDNYAILMAGGIGSRFWPVSTSEFPKQFHDMLGSGKTLIQQTFDRLLHTVPAENIFILTNGRYADLVQDQLPQVQGNQIVLEPAMRNTAPCILYASMKINKINPQARIIVAPSDHWIEDEKAFSTHLEVCFEYASTHNALLTLGIQPTFPNTGYGYIEYDCQDENPIKKVNQFREKPTYEKAKEFLAQGNYLWNAGIFIWTVESILRAFEQYKPDLFQLFSLGEEFYNTPKEARFIAQHYPLAENISIDYAIMEAAENVYVLPAKFDWNDLGTWGSLHQKLPKDSIGNSVVNARVLLEDASGNLIRTAQGKTVIVSGLTDYIIVDHENTLLIYPMEKEQDIKQVAQKAGQ